MHMSHHCPGLPGVTPNEADSSEPRRREAFSAVDPQLRQVESLEQGTVLGVLALYTLPKLHPRNCTLHTLDHVR